MKNSLFLATIFLMVVTGSLGGRITAWGDPDITNPNSGRVNSMNIYFSLDNRLPAGHVLRVTLPFATTPNFATAGAIIYTAASASKGAFVSLASPTATTTSNFVRASTAAPFHNYFMFPADLAAATNYVMKLTFGTVPTDTAGFLGYIQIETMSPALSVGTAAGTGDMAITYDLNNAFAPVQIFPAPGNITTFTITSDTNTSAPGAASLRQFAFTPTQNFFYWPVIQITWDQPTLSISSVISHDTGANSSNLTQLSYGSGINQFYTTNPSNITLNIYHNAPLSASQTVKYNITTQNPSPSSALTVNFNLRVFHRYNLNLTDITSNTSVSITAVAASGSPGSASTTINAYQILLSWGVDGSTFTSHLAKVFQIYPSTTANPLYQAVRWVFGFTGTISTGSYQANVTICTTATNCDVLENSLVNANMTGATCYYTYGYAATPLKVISCNATGFATTGNMIGGRIWLNSANVVAAPAALTSTINDTAFGTITISSYASATNTYTSVTSARIGDYTKYNVAATNTAPLPNINGNGPLIAMPTTGSPVGTTNVYATLWSGSAAASPAAATSAGASITPCTLPTAGGTACTLLAFGGIYGTNTASTKYNVALMTTAKMMSGTTFGIDGTANTNTFTGFPGVDLYMNPNIWSNAGTPASGSNASIVASCWANNAPAKPAATITFTSTVAPAAATMAAHCYSNLVSTANANYIRLRWLATINTNAGATTIKAAAGASNPAAVDTDLTGAGVNKYLTFFWESGLQMANAWAGSSLKADANVGDYYGIFYGLSGTVSAAGYPGQTGSYANSVTSATAATDVGELGTAAVNGLAITSGNSFFWPQMIMGPYGKYDTAAASSTALTTDYFNRKQVFLSGYVGIAGALSSTYNSNTAPMTIRIRGQLSGTNDTNTFPSSGGRMALFIGTTGTTLGSIIEPLGTSTTTNILGASGYNTQPALATGVYLPLLGNGNVRCWNAGALASCSLDRYGRVPAAATLWNVATAAGVTPSGGQTNTVDQYEIISTNATFATGNFSIAILVKPVVAAAATDFNKYFYRLGFVTTSGLYYLQSWDQLFDNGASLNGTSYTLGAGTQVYAPWATITTVQWPNSGSNTTCTAIPFTSTSSPGIRISPNTNDLDNAFATASVTLNVQLSTTNASQAIGTPAKFQGQVMWCTQWNFAQNATVNSTNLESTAASGYNDRCVTFDYLPSEASALTFYCLYCPIANAAAAIPNGGSSSPAAITIASFYDGPAINVPTPIMSAISGDTGTLAENSYCGTTISTSNIWTAQTITILAAPTSLYNVSGQKITIGFNAPSGLATTMVDTIVFNGRQNATNTLDSTFPFGGLDTNAVCRLVPTASIGNYTAYLRCTAGINGGIITINGIDPITSTTVTGYTLFIWGFNGNTPATTATGFYLMQTYKSSTTFIVDQTNSTNTAYSQWTVANGTSTLTATVGGYQRTAINARGYFRFDLAMSPRPWFYNDKIVISLDAIASASVNSNASVVKCRITDTTSSENIHYGFQSCTFAPGATPTLTILGMTPSGTVYPYDVNTNSGVRVYLDNVVTVAQQANKTIYGGVTFLGISGTSGTQVLSKVATNLTDINPNNISSTQAFPSGYPTITKWWYSANDFQDVNFNLITATVFNSSCRITIAFPSYYNPGLATHSTQPYCTINNAYVQCSVGTVSSTGAVTLQQAQRQLVVWGFGGSAVSANTSFVLRVNGISAPPANYTAETFWVQINGDNTDVNTTVIYYGSVADANYATPATIFPLNVFWFGVGSTATRTLTSFTWSVYLNNASATVNVSSAIQIIFPESWGLAWGSFAPTCQVTDYISATTMYTAAISSSTGNNSIFGNLVNMNVTTAIAAGALFNVTCSGIRTGNNDGTYRSDDVTLRIVDASGTFTWFRSAPGQHNVNRTYSFTKQASQSYLTWTASTTGNFGTPVPLTAGTFNAPLRINVPSTSSRSFMVTVSTANFAFLTTTTPFWVTTGAVFNTTALGCSGSVAAGLYAVNFAVSDNSSLYLAPGPLYVWVNNNAQSISPSATTLTTYFQSTSVTSMTAPLTFDLTNFPPFSDITITPNLTSLGNTNFTFTPASIKLTAANPKGYFTFSSTSTASATGSANYAFALSGTNAASYTVASAVTVSLTADSGSNAVSTPVLAIIADSTDTGLATTKVITFTLTQVTAATIYWVVTLQGQAITDATTIMNNVAILTQYSANSANQAQYGSTFLVASSKTSFTISNLFPYTGYTVSAVAVSQTNKNSTVASYTFVTGANAAPIQRWLFNYTAGTYPSQSVRQTLLCTITQTLAVPAINVRNVHGEICGNTSAFYSTSNTTSGDLGMYFYPLPATTDTTMTATNLAALLNGTTTLGTLNNTLNAATANTGFLNIATDLTYIPRQAPNISIPSSIPSASLTTASINFALSSVNETGFLFVALCSNASTAPTAIQMKQAAANLSSITGLISLQVFYYYPGAVPTYNFTGLSAATSYNVYVTASNNDPSFLQNFTSVSSISVTTPTTGSTTGAGQMGVMFSVIAIFASVISLMFF